MSKNNSKNIPLIICLIISLVLSACCVVVAFSYRSRNHQLESEMSNTVASLEDSVSSYAQAFESVEEKIASQESDIAQKDKEIKEYESMVASYQKALELKKTGSTKTEVDPETVRAQKNNYDGPRKCFLTFDDGPSDNTWKILDVLDQYGIKATFFVVHNNPELLRAISDRGHAIGLHTASHQYSKIYSSDEAFFEDLTAIGDIVENAVGYRPHIMRFPGGSSNTVSKNYSRGIMTRLTKKVVDSGYMYYDWNASDGDANGSNVPVETLLYNIRCSGTESQRKIVLMHDAADKGTTPQALPAIIEYYRDAGYEFDRLSTDIPMLTQAVAN